MQVDKILFYVDQDEARFGHAAEIAEALGAGITLVTVVPPYPSWRGDAERIQKLLVDDSREKLERIGSDSGVVHAARVLVGRPAEEIIQEVDRGGYDLLLKSPAPDGRGLDRLAGTIDMRLLRACPCPVGIIRPESQGEFKRVVAAVDIEHPAELNQAILEWAMHAGTKRFDELHLLHAWTLFGESLMRSGHGRVPPEELAAELAREEQRRREPLDELTKFVEKRLGEMGTDFPRPKAHLVKGDPGPVVHAFLEQVGADLLVLGTQSRAGLPGLLIGNTAERLLGQVSCSVLTVKSAGS